jgi:hypothetical protein
MQRRPRIKSRMVLPVPLAAPLMRIVSWLNGVGQNGGMGMRRVEFLMLFALTLGTSACSSIDTFAILNNTDAPLRLEYTFKISPSDNISLHKQLSLIATAASDKAGEVDCPWVLLSSSQYSYDQTTQKVTMQVPPAMAVRIAQLSNYVETDEWAAEHFPIGSITVEGARGVIHCEGEQTRKQFRNLKRSLHAADYR